MACAGSPCVRMHSCTQPKSARRMLLLVPIHPSPVKTNSLPARTSTQLSISATEKIDGAIECVPPNGLSRVPLKGCGADQHTVESSRARERARTSRERTAISQTQNSNSSLSAWVWVCLCVCGWVWVLCGESAKEAHITKAHTQLPNETVACLVFTEISLLDGSATRGAARRQQLASWLPNVRQDGCSSAF